MKALEQTLMGNLFASLDRRWRRSIKTIPALRWQAFLFLTANLVLLAGVLFDFSAGASAARKIATPLSTFGRVLTDLGKSDWIIWASLFVGIEGWAVSRLLCSPKERGKALQISWTGVYILITICLSGLSSNLLKRAIGRARPEHFDTWGIFGFKPFAGQASFESFPSGHATTIGALAMALVLLFPRYRLIFIACGLWLGMTRVMVGAHYPSDVIAGLAFGGWFSFITALIFARYALVFRVDKDGWPKPRRQVLLIKNPALSAPGNE